MITWITGVWAWLRANPVVARILTWVAIGFALFIGAKTYKAKVEAAARKKAQNEYRVESAKAETRVVETIRTIEKETRHEADLAIEVRDTAPVHHGPDSMSDEKRRRIFSDADDHSGS